MEEEFKLRSELVEEALTWRRTPYVGGQGVKGSGCDCGRFPLKVFQKVGLVPKEFDPGHYSQQWHMHQDEERYLNWVAQFTHEYSGPPDNIPMPGDVVMFKFGRVYAHGSIVIDWPKVIHVMVDSVVRIDNIHRCRVGKWALYNLPKRYFSYWLK